MNLSSKKPQKLLFTACLLLFVGLFFLTSSSRVLLAIQDPPATPDQETRIIILHYNDAHAKIDNLPKIAWYVAEERKKNEHVFLLNAGDNFSGNPVVDMAEPKGEPVRLLMNKMGLDVLELGNHEFDYDQEILNNFIRQANYPVICANVKVNTPTLPQPAPYVILKTKNGIPIAVLGVVEVSKDTGLPASHPQKLRGLLFSDPIEVAKTYRYLREKNQVFVLLSHMGLEDDVQLATQMNELDVIVGGHSHTTIQEPKETNGVLITQAGSQGQFIGRIELVVKNGRVIQKSASLIDVKSIKEGIPDMEKMVADFNNNPVLETEITTLPRPIWGNYELGYLITDSMRIQHHLDFTFHNSGGIRIQKLNKKVVVKDIYSLNPFGNRVVAFKMTLAELRSLLRFDFERYKNLDIKISGFSYTVRHTPDYKVIDIALRDLKGKPLDETKTYMVGMNDYMTLTYKFDHQDPGKSLEVTIAQTLMDYLKTAKDVCSGLRMVRSFSQLVADTSLVPIGQTAVEISAGTSLEAGVTTAGNLAADAMAAFSGADIAFYPHRLQNFGPIVAGPGPLYKENLLSLYPLALKNKIVTAMISGLDLETFVSERCTQAHGVDLQVSGLNYTVTIDKEENVTAVRCTLPNGKPLDKKTLYKVAFNEFEWSKNYQLEKVAVSPVTSEQALEEILLDYIKKKGTIGANIQEQRVQVQQVTTQKTTKK